MNDDGLRLEIEALRARLSALESDRDGGAPTTTTVASLARPPGWSPPNIVPPPSSSIAIHALIGTDGLPRHERELRGCLEAVALGYGIDTPRIDIPRAWIAPLRDVYAARTGGATWAAALAAAGLEVPGESDLTAHQHALRSELGELWDAVPMMTEWVRRNTLSSIAYRDLTLLLRQLLM